MNSPWTLIFDWPTRKIARLALPLTLLLSAGLHFAGIEILQIRPPAAQTGPPQAPQVFFLPRSGASFEWARARVAASDPVLFSSSDVEEKDVWRIPADDYRPSFATLQPGLDPLPPTQNEMPPPDAQVGPVRGDVPSPPPAQPAPRQRTQIVFGGDLRGAKFIVHEEVTFAAPVRQNLAPLEFLVGADPSTGRVLHAVPLNTSGFAPLDRQATETLMTGHAEAVSGTPSEAGSGDPVWGTAWFLWGGDVSRTLSP